MNKSALKKFAIEARLELIEKVKVKALMLGITEDKIKKESVQSSDSVFIEGKQLSIDEQRQRNKLIEEIKTKGYNQVIEEAAYTWFNRFTALRFMEVNDYLPTKVRALSSTIEGSFEPDIIKEALNIDLDVDKEYIFNLKMSNDNDAIDKLYKYLIIKQSNALGLILPFMFEKILDYTELLFPDGLLNEGSFLRVMTDINNIPEDDWKEIEVIGWLYQYYISERKQEVFDGLKKNIKITKDDIAPATQLFTPHWIVRYMVENSVGKLWQEGHPNEELKKTWRYYIEEVEQEEEVQIELEKIREESRDIKVEDIKIIDPAMGSGHILVYAFDLLYDIYLSEGYIAHEIPKLIIEKNLYGLDIDQRAFQLAYFAMMMKGRAKNRRFFNQDVDVNLCFIKESNEFSKNAIKYFTNSKSLELEKQILQNDLEYLIDIFHDATEYGSILKVKKINFDTIRKRLKELESEAPEDIFELQYRDKILEIVPNLLKQGKIMSDKYDVYITNPPYMGSKGMNPRLSEYVSKEYPDTKADLFAVFMELDEHLVKSHGYMAMINQHSWMFLSSFEKYRTRLLETRTIDTMLHLGARTFEEIGGEVVQSTAFVNRKIRVDEYKGIYIRLVDYNTAENKEQKTIEALNNHDVKYRYISMINNYNKIPGNQIAYWATNNHIRAFIEGKNITDFVDTFQGIITGNNEKFLRLWYEVIVDKIAFNKGKMSEINLETMYWVPYNKGGEFRKWYGNQEFVVFWKYGPVDKTRGKKSFQDYYLKEYVSWSYIAMGTLATRYFPKGFLWDVSGSGIFDKSNHITYLQSLIGSKVGIEFLNMINPTINYQVENIMQLPIIVSEKYKPIIDSIVKQNILISKIDWDSFEISWDFIVHPLINLKLVKCNSIEEAYNCRKEYTASQFSQLKYNEEELNRIFITIYGLQDELTPEVKDKDITISIADRERDVKSFISYAIGCIFGRYSLDEQGLVYAGGELDLDKYNTYPADKDNVVPIVSEAYFEDDIVSRIVDFVRITFGDEHIGDNLKFIADSLGVRGNETPKETLRRYLLNDFYKDHLKIYKNRPIYWMFTSGKQKSFNALIYMHRYDSSTLSRIRTDYLHVFQSRLDGEKNSLLQNIDSAENIKDRKLYEKELNNLDKKIKELKEYDEILHHKADMKIDIGLDDGVKVNYEKFKDLLEKI